MSKSIHIAIGSTTSKPGDALGNLEQIRSFARQAGEDGADLLLTPELSASGYGIYPDVFATAEVAGDGPVYRALATIARESGVVVFAGFVEAVNAGCCLSHYAVYPGGEFAVQRKQWIMSSEFPFISGAELEWSTPLGTLPVGAVEPGQPQEPQFNIITVSGVDCAVVICADNGLVQLNEILEKKGVQVLLCPTASGGRRSERVTTDELRTLEGQEKYLAVLNTVFSPGRIPLECIRYRRAQAAVNLCGYDGRDYYHVGHGSITNAMGEVVGFFHGLPNLDRQRPMYAHAEIDLGEAL